MHILTDYSVKYAVVTTMNKKARTQDTIILLINLSIIGVISLIFYHYWYEYYHSLVYFYQKGNWMILCVYFVCLFVFNSVYGGFKLGSTRTSDLMFSQIISLLFSNLVVYIVASFVNKGLIPVQGFIWIVVVQTVASIIINILVNKVFYNAFPAKKTVLLYESKYSSVYSKILKYQAKSFHIEKKIDISINSDYLKQIIKEYECIIMDHVSTEHKEQIIKYCYDKSISLFEVPNIYDIIQNNAMDIHLIDTPMFKLNKFGPDQVSKIIKRVFDIVFAMIFIILTSPIWLIVAIAIKLNDGGPVFYKQVRLTQHGKLFKILKFRSMKMNAEKDGKAQFAKENDDRITSVGKVIRACRFDELPQLLNILIGDMSVVGPRPERPEIVAEIIKTLPEFSFRLKVKAGLTGYAQVFGKYNTNLKDKLLLDLMYIEDFSLLLDLKIIFMTVKIIFMKESTEGVDDHI